MNTWNYKRHRAGKFFFLIFITGITFLLAAIVMYLWNAIIPDILPASPLTYWQAMGLFILSRILFGGFRFRPPGMGLPPHARQEWREKWANMTEEEKQKLKETWREKCGKKG